ncbi:hypothetical protein JCM14076_06210 [Methylosoma difficile]
MNEQKHLGVYPENGEIASLKKEIFALNRQLSDARWNSIVLKNKLDSAHALLGVSSFISVAIVLFSIVVFSFRN